MREWMYLGHYTDCAASVHDIKGLKLGWIRLPAAGCFEYVSELSSPSRDQ